LLSLLEDGLGLLNLGLLLLAALRVGLLLLFEGLGGGDLLAYIRLVGGGPGLVRVGVHGHELFEGLPSFREESVPLLLDRRDVLLSPLLFQIRELALQRKELAGRSRNRLGGTHLLGELRQKFRG
jgi:hypothetical protein